MPTPSHILTCTGKSLIAPGVYELVFTRPEGLTFKAGQFLLFDVPLKSNPADIQPRAFSIASTPREKDLLFVVKLKAGGRASTWIEHQLQTGTSVRIQGPFGFFTLKDAAAESELIFAATGAGIAPFRSQLLSALDDTGDKRPMHLLFGVRSREDFFWLRDFEGLASRHAHFCFHPILSGKDDAWKGLRGRIQMHLPSVTGALTKPGIYICGAPEMVKDVKDACLTTLGIPKAQVHAEGYI